MWLARSADVRYGRRVDETTGRGAARVLDITVATEPVGEPRYRSEGLEPDAVEAQYVSDIGRNEQDPVPTGLHVLDDPDHPDVPKAVTHPEAGDDALPVDVSGEVVPPAVPTEPRLQLPLDELLAKKLARGLVPVRLVGPRGSGKNYLVKYLCHRTNRGYVSVDCDEATHTEDLFGPLTPTEDGLIAPRNGPAKQALLNGSVLVLNEFPVMRAGAAMSLHRLLNEGKLLVKAHGELVEPHPSARIIITMNPPTREYRDSEPMNSATRGRFRALEQPYIQDVDEEVATLDAQVNASHEVVDRGTLRKIVQFAHQTRQNENWPTLSTRNLTVLCEHIEDGASPKAAVKNEVWAVAEPNQYPDDTYETLNDYL
jgi:nitric oxide reductase NorQ protein